MGVLVLFLLVFLSMGNALDISLINYQAYSLIDHMKRIEDFPEVIEGRQIREWILEDKLPEGKLFMDNREFKEKDLLNLMKRANLEGLKEVVLVKFGWTLRRANMRMYPSDLTLHKGNPKIDYNQYTLLEPFTPLAILHPSEDGDWLYVHAPYMRGWVKRQEVMISTREDLLAILQRPFLVVVKDKIKIEGFVFGLGSRIPYVEKGEGSYRVLLPNLRAVGLKNREGLEEGFVSFGEDRARSILDKLLGTPYDWGGKDGRWDCSSLVQGLYAVFGLELPRNSAQQAKIGKVVARGFSSYEEFKGTVAELPPFRTLIFMKGHVMIYGGLEKGDVVLYHAVHRMTNWIINKISKNYVERDGLRDIYKKVVSVNLLD
ncbi:MAG: SH3 domain-containing protein [Aquificaceae bacterium]